jgi:hypothetical protein
VGGDDDRHRILPAQLGQQVEDPGRGARVQVAGRLVGQQQVRGVDQGRAMATRCCSPPAAAPSPVVGLLVTAAELHARADLEVVDAAERDLTEDALAALSAARPITQPSGTGLSGTGTSGAPVTGQPDEVQTSGRT